MQRREFMAGLGAAAGDAVLQFDHVYGQGGAVAHRKIHLLAGASFLGGPAQLERGALLPAGFGACQR